MSEQKVYENEYRTYSVQDLELRTEEGNDKRTIIGYASVFDTESQDLGGFTEIVRRGAFAKTIQEADVRALFNHDPNFVLGRSKNGTLRMSEDDRGLRVEIDPPDSADSIVESIKRGDIDQMSFGFQVIKERWTEDVKEDRVVRELLEVRLFDVSPVTFPAYEETSVGVRSLNKALTKLKKDLTISEKDDIILRELKKELDERFSDSETIQEGQPVDHKDIEEREEIKKIDSLELLKQQIKIMEQIADL